MHGVRQHFSDERVQTEAQKGKKDIAQSRRRKEGHDIFLKAKVQNWSQYLEKDKKIDQFD